jgi:hypothetical protein
MHVTFKTYIKKLEKIVVITQTISLYFIVQILAYLFSSIVNFWQMDNNPNLFSVYKLT